VKKRKPGLGQAVEMSVGLADQLVGLLGRGVKRERMVDPVLDPEGQAVIAAIDRR
jgi:hypothetical protein